MAKAATVETREYLVPMRLEYQTIVIVEATSPEQAKLKAEGANLADDGHAGAELINWEVTGRVRENV